MLAALLANLPVGGLPPGYTLPDGRRVRAANDRAALEEFLKSLVKPPPKKLVYTLPNPRSLKTTATAKAWSPIPAAKPRMYVPQRLTLAEMISTKKIPANRRLLGKFRLRRAVRAAKAANKRK